MKLSKEIFIQHAKRIKFIINESSPFLAYLKKESLITVLQSSLNILYILENKFNDVKIPVIYSSKNLIKNFNKFSKNGFTIKKPIQNLSDDEIIDTINYLPIYFKNIFRVDIDQMIKNKKNIANNNQATFLPNQNMKQYGINSSYDNNNIFFNDLNQTNIQNISKKMLYDFKNDKTYIYQSKSKLIPILKLLLIIFLSFSCLALFLCFVFAILSKDLLIMVDGEQKWLGQNAILSGCTYGVIGLITIYQIYSLIKDLNSRNENRIYHTRLLLPFITIIFALLFIGPDIKWTWLIYHYIDKISENEQLILLFYQIWKYLYLVIISLFVANLIIIIITKVFNPPINSELLLDQIGKYMNKPTSDSFVEQNDNPQNKKKEQKVNSKKEGSSNDKKRKNNVDKK